MRTLIVNHRQFKVAVESCGRHGLPLHATAKRILVNLVLIQIKIAEQLAGLPGLIKTVRNRLSGEQDDHARVVTT